MKIETRQITELVPYEKNPRKNTAAVDEVVKSLNKHGHVKPLVLSAPGYPFPNEVICCGHTTLKALKKCGIQEANVIIHQFKDESEFIDYNLRDNKTGEFAAWDDDMLLDFQDTFDIDLDDMGFDLNEMTPKEGEIGDDEVPEPTESRCKLGELWKLGEHRLLCGDSTDKAQVEILMAGEKADMVFTDPPYGIDVVQKNTIGGGGAFGGKKNLNQNKDNEIKANRYSPVIGDDTTNTAESFYKCVLSLDMKNMIIWGGNYFTAFLPQSRGWLCWDKIDGVEGTTKNFSDIELAWTSYNVPARIVRHRWQGLLKASEQKEKRVHPTQKPIALAVETFGLYDSGNIVFDGFGGSGSTLIACEKTGRKCRMMELDEKYCDVIINRWEKFTGQHAEQIK